MLDIYFGFQNILEENKPVEFINTFFGLPIQNQGRLIKVVEQGHVIARVPTMQIVGMQSNPFTFIKSDLLPSTLKAKVVEANLPSGIVELADFEYTDDAIGKRKSMRVAPEAPIQVSLIPEESTRNHLIRSVEIVEISVEGLAVVIDRTFFDVKSFGKDKKVLIKYQLPIDDDEKEEVGYEGIIRNIILGKKCRIGIEVYPESGVKLVIARYIAHRREQLINQINDLCEEGVHKN